MALFDAITRVKPPRSRNFGNEITQILGQSGRVAADQYDQSAFYDPLYSRLNRNTLSGSLFGDQTSPGYVDIWNRGLDQLDASRGAGSYVGQLRDANPGQATLYDALMKSAGNELAAGSRLSPDETYSISQPIRSDWAARGFAPSLPASLDEAVNLSRAGDNRLAQRQAAAGSALGLGNDLYTSPAFAAQQQNRGTLGALLGLGTQGAQHPDTFGSLMGYGSDLFNTNYNAKAAAKIASANNETGFASSLASY